MFRTWSWAVVLCVVVVVASIVTINVVVDAYGILRKDFSRQFQEVNLNYVKMNYLLKHREKFDSFILGSSRAEKIDPRLIANGRYYDLTYPLGVPKEHLDNLRLLLKSGVKIRNVLVALDDFSSRITTDDRISDLQLQPHPAISGKKLVTFWGEYYCKLKQFVPQLKAYIEYNYPGAAGRKERKYIYDLFGTGRVLCPSCDERIEADRGRHVSDPSFGRLVISAQGNNSEDVVKTMRAIVDLATTNGIHLVVFVNPVHRKAYLDTDLRQFAKFKRELARITDYYDFSGLNAVTTNNYYYYETSHYRPMVGEMMLKVMFGSPDVAVPRGFGVHVTSAIIDRHLLAQCRELRSVRGSYQFSELNTAFVNSCDALPVVP